MIDEVLAGIFGEVVLGRLTRSRRAQLVFRLAFGLLGAGLAVAGAWYLGVAEARGTGPALRAGASALFFFLACFAFFNVALARKWRWPGRLFVASLIALFVIRIVFGP